MLEYLGREKGKKRKERLTKILYYKCKEHISMSLAIISSFIHLLDSLL